MILRWLRTIALAGIGLILLFAYSTAYVNVILRPPQEFFRSEFFRSSLPVILLLVYALPFLAGLMFGLAAFNGPIRGIKFSVLNFLGIALLPMLFGCGLPTLGAAARLIEPLRRLMITPLFREPTILQLQPMMALVAGIGIGVAFIRGSEEPPALTTLVEAVSPPEAEEVEE